VTYPCSSAAETSHTPISHATMDPNLLVFFGLLGLIGFLSYMLECDQLVMILRSVGM